MSELPVPTSSPLTRPTAQDVDRMWGELVFEPAPLADPAVDALLAALCATRVNGGALLARWRIRPHPTLSWFTSGCGWEEIGFPERFFLRAAVVATAPPELDVEHKAKKADFAPRSAYTFEGELLEALMQGGAYERFRGSVAEARELASVFRAGLFGDRYEEVQVFFTWKAWTPWFYDIAWDGSWLILDREGPHVTLLCVTDTD